MTNPRQEGCRVRATTPFSTQNVDRLRSDPDEMENSRDDLSGANGKHTAQKVTQGEHLLEPSRIRIVLDKVFQTRPEIMGLVSLVTGHQK